MNSLEQITQLIMETKRKGHETYSLDTCNNYYSAKHNGRPKQRKSLQTEVRPETEEEQPPDRRSSTKG